MRTQLLVCRHCGRHAFWKFSDGTRSDVFFSKSDGALQYMEALISERADPGGIAEALRLLGVTKLPRILVIKLDVTTVHTQGVPQNDVPFSDLFGKRNNIPHS